MAHTVCVHVPQIYPFKPNGLLSKPARVHVANMRAHQSTESSGEKPRPCFFSLTVSALREQTEAQGPKCERCLSWLDLGVCTRTCVCTRICVVNHIKDSSVAQLLWPLTLACSKTEGGWRRRGRKNSQAPPATTHTQKRVGYKITPAIDSDVAICLINFYRNL